MKVLVLFAHPALENDLYEEYPDHHIDVGCEQELLLAHDVFVFQHPFFWYSGPAILKEWQDPKALFSGRPRGSAGDRAPAARGDQPQVR